jgi:ABC-type proline/glycine betaine transport system permease subunit
MILGGAIPLAILAIIIDTILGVVEKKVTSTGLQLKKADI